jgi:Na+-transporting NADH:ubiquinone oxidoreductase subunit D
MGRAETYAMGNPAGQSLIDGIANGIGYGSILCGVAFFRELLGAGKLFGYPVIPQSVYEAGYQNMGLMQLAPGAFIMIGLFVWLEHALLGDDEWKT